jgi:hypothetical protein
MSRATRPISSGRSTRPKAMPFGKRANTCSLRVSCVAHYEQPALRLLHLSLVFWPFTNVNVGTIRVNVLSNSRKFATPYQQRDDADGLHRGRAHPLGQPRAGARVPIPPPTSTATTGMAVPRPMTRPV